MSNWQNQKPQAWDNNYGNQYGGYSKKNGYAENQYQNNYYNQTNTKKNPLQHQYPKPKQKNYQGQNGYPGPNQPPQKQQGYEQGPQVGAKMGMGANNQHYKTNDDVRPLTERPQQPFQQFGQKGDQNRYNSIPYLGGNQAGYNTAPGGNDQNYSRRDRNRAKSMRKGGNFDDAYTGNQNTAFASPNPNTRGAGANNYMNTFNGSKKSPMGRRSPGGVNPSMRETMEPRYNQRDEGGARRFLSPQPQRDNRGMKNDTRSSRDIQRPFWKSPNGKGRAKSRKMNLTLKDIQREEAANQRPNFGGFEPSTNDSARGIRNNDGSKRESK